MAKELTLIEQNTLKQFAMNFSKEIQKFQECKTYEEVKKTMKDLDNIVDDDATSPINILMNKIHNYDETI